MTADDVVVVGGGIIGLTIGWRAAAAGLSVTVCDPSPGRGASWVAAGMLAPVTEATVAEAPLARLGLTSLRRWPAYASTLAEDAGLDPDGLGLRCDGTLQVAFDDDDQRALQELADVHRTMGLASEQWATGRCRQVEPLLSPRLRAGLFVAGDWQVDPRLVVGALRTALGHRGGQLVTAPVRRLIAADGGAVAGVELGDGTVVRAGAVVLAAGTGSTAVAGVPPEGRPPVRPVKGELLRLRAAAGQPALSVTVRGVVRGQAVYLVPRRHGELVVGATMQEAGYDTSVRAGAVADLLQAAIDVVPAVAELALVEHIAGLRPATPDNAPALGPTPVPGLHVATGHFRNGVLLAPVTGDVVLAGLLGGALPAEAAPFDIGRFAA